MIEVYDVNTIIAYVNGDDIEGFEIEDLENNYLFMFEVILYTNDKKMYNLCSEEVKCNFNFVKLLINKYKDDLDFICSVADYFIENTKEDEENSEVFEIALMIYKQLKSKEEDAPDDKLIQYNVLVRQLYKIEMFAVDYCKNYLDDETKDCVGKGFLAVESKYSGNKMILDYFAENMILEIFEENEIDLEKLIHDQFSSYEDLKKYGEYKYCVNLISKYDESLGNYISVNKHLLVYFEKRLKAIRKKWNVSNEYYLKEKYHTMFYIVQKYLDDENYEMMASYIGKELGILEQIITYEYDGDSELVMDFIKMAEEEKANFPYDFFVTHQKVRKIMLDVLKSNDNDQMMKKYFNLDGTFNYNYADDDYVKGINNKFRR